MQIRWLVEYDCPQNIKEDFQYLKTRSNRSIASLFLQHPRASFTVLYSHGNAEDLGYIRPLLMHLSFNCQVNVMCYDYAGYGLSQGSPCETATYEDVEAAYAFLVKDKSIPSSKIILLGRSLGSGPTCECALRHHKEIAGVIIQSGLLSAIRVLYDWRGLESPVDIYKNYQKVPQISCPTYVIHGMDDNVIPSSHGQRLGELCQNPWRCWLIEGTGHNDVENRPAKAYFTNISAFLRHVEHKSQSEPAEAPSIEKKRMSFSRFSSSDSRT
eukprot:TRINITY_DN4944_c0_g1_i2.p1 TRINITY_DN4944_c0_g1~~TRINITY_DN4944_c0_g1_i2.p1  ORF type:complete len:270 (-),score=48.86 TRINITY_DN4944_c0_g1_i2:205-1014(-)